MKTLYESQIEIKIGKFAIDWNFNQATIQSILQGEFESSEDEMTNTKQDIFHSINGYKCMLIFNYQPNNQLSEIIIHYGVDLEIGIEKFNFNSKLGNLLAKTSFEYDYFGEDEIYFHELNLSITNDLFMGGEGNKIGSITIKRN